MKKIAIIPIVVVATIVAVKLYARFWFGLGDPPLSEGTPDIDYISKPTLTLQRTSATPSTRMPPARESSGSSS